MKKKKLTLKEIQDAIKKFEYGNANDREVKIHFVSQAGLDEFNKILEKTLKDAAKRK